MCQVKNCTHWGTSRYNKGMKFFNTANIAVRSIMLRNFEMAEIEALLLQHTKEAGQVFTAESVQRIWHLTQGQPWLVNALAKVAVEELIPDWEQPIAVEAIDTAKELLILRRQTHLDQLTDKL